MSGTQGVFVAYSLSMLLLLGYAVRIWVEWLRASGVANR